jgi:hypothetical protein
VNQIVFFKTKIAGSSAPPQTHLRRNASKRNTCIRRTSGLRRLLFVVGIGGSASGTPTELLPDAIQTGQSTWIPRSLITSLVEKSGCRVHIERAEQQQFMVPMTRQRFS